MRRLISVWRVWEGQRELRIFESQNKLRGEVRCFKNNAPLMSADFFNDEATEYRVKEYFGLNNAYKVPFERRNGKIVLYPINKQRRVIYTNQDYDEWKEAMLLDLEEGEDESCLTYERYYQDCEVNLEDERANLAIDVHGYIVAFGSLGLWNGRVNGAKMVGYEVADILSSSNDYVTWYCDVHNVRYEGVHHDGTNYALYRVARSKEHAESLLNRIAYGNMTEEQFRRETKSLRPYIAKVYGF